MKIDSRLNKKPVKPTVKVEQPASIKAADPRPPRNRTNTILASIAGVLFLLFAGIFGYFGYQYWRYQQLSNTFPVGTTVAGIDVSDMTYNSALRQITSSFEAPVELVYRDQIYQLDPTAVGFELRADEMLSLVQPTTAQLDFFDFLQGKRPEQAQDIPMRANYSNGDLMTYLQNIAGEVNETASPPIIDTERVVVFEGKSGMKMDVGSAVPLVNQALFSSTNRRVILTATEEGGGTASFDQFGQSLRQYLQERNVTGLFSIFLYNFETDEVIRFHRFEGQEVVLEPDIAYSGMSLMKIAILAEFYRQLDDGNGLPYELDLVKLSITESSNYASNEMINWIGDLNDSTGLYRMNEFFTATGMSNSFLGGLYDSTDAPGFRYTPANQRTDINTFPDVYMQTSPNDMGRLLVGMYECADDYTGILVETYGDQFTQGECQSMIDWLAANELGTLIQGGVPAGTVVAHKHAWAAGEPIADGGLVFTPGGDYALVYYIWYPEYTYWDENKVILEDISRFAYSFFNPTPAGTIIPDPTEVPAEELGSDEAQVEAEAEAEE